MEKSVCYLNDPREYSEVEIPVGVSVDFGKKFACHEWYGEKPSNGSETFWAPSQYSVTEDERVGEWYNGFTGGDRPRE